MTFDNNQANALREAIDKTIGRLTPHPMGGGLSKVVLDQLTEHLAALLEQERRLFTAAAALSPTGADAPWYPDDSGDWVEVPDDLMSMPPELDREDTVAVLTKAERALRNYVPGSSCARAFAWVSPPTEGRRIVAYKKVKP